jgi:hypothetical protein
MNGAPNGIYAYSYSNGSLLELISSGSGPGNTGPLNTWNVNRTPVAMAALGIINVAPSTYIAGYGYLTVQSSLDAVSQRLFYQTTNGNIVSAYHSGLTGSAGWVVDTTIATGLPLGTPISAFITVVSGSRVVCFLFCHMSHSESLLCLLAIGGDSVHRCPWAPYFSILQFGCGRVERSSHDFGMASLTSRAHDICDNTSKPTFPSYIF